MVGVRVRVNGVLQWLVGIPSDHHPNICGRFKVMANLESHTTGLPQDGKAAPEEFGGVQLRVSIFPTVFGEKIVCRVFNPNSKVFDISKLGFDDATLERFKELAAKPTGLMLLTGPTGSGKTTAIYTAIGYLLEKHGNAVAISSVEDPVEQNLDWVNQSSLNPARGYNYPAALRSLMRQDPEIIMVGEIRDEETAEIAINAGMTGHLVISTLHSNTTSGTFARLINMDIEPFLLASTIIGVLGVRLLRTNCMHCAGPYTPEPAPLSNSVNSKVMSIYRLCLINRALSRRRLFSLWRCRFSGRTSINELLVCTEPVREAVMQKRASREIQASPCRTACALCGIAACNSWSIAKPHWRKPSRRWQRIRFGTVCLLVWWITGDCCTNAA